MADLFFNSCHSLSLPDTDLNIVEFMNHFPGMNPGQQEAAFSCQGLTGFHHDNISPQFSECCSGNLENFHGDFSHLEKATVSYFDEPVVSIGSDNRDRKRKGIKTDPGTPESTSVHSSPRVKANLQGRGKKGKVHAKTDDKESKEVIHVRARRGQATDSHSLAERVRRGKINERIHLLKDIVPGCYKNMGMAVMLDETINYVQSLQNQVEFLSMKITAASTYHDFNCVEDSFNPMQGIPCSQFPSPDINFGNFQQFPHS